MRRKKKKEEPEIYHTPFRDTVLPPPDYFGPGLHIMDNPYVDVTTLGDTERRYITTTNPGISMTYTGSTGEPRTLCYPPTHLENPYSSTIEHKDYTRLIIREESNVKIDKIKLSHPYGYRLVCQNEEDLIPEKILTTLSAMKNQLVYETLHYVPYSVPEIQCKMTPQVKSNLITVGKKLRMYGKRIPIIPNFDDYGNRLPDQIEILEGKGIGIIIVDPKEYKELYLEIKVTKKLSSCSDPDWWKELSDDWLPS